VPTRRSASFQIPLELSRNTLRIPSSIILSEAPSGCSFLFRNGFGRQLTFSTSLKSPLGPKDAAQGTAGIFRPRFAVFCSGEVEERPLGKCHQWLNYTPSTTTRQLPSRSIFKGRMGKGRKLEDANLWRVGICIAKNRLKCSGDGVDLVLRLFYRG
jgi:hypothetical protein